MYINLLLKQYSPQKFFKMYKFSLLNVLFWGKIGIW